MIKHISILLICIMLALSISFVFPILPVVRAEPNSDPINSDPYPSNGTTDITLVPISLSITVNDIDNIPAVNEDKAVDGYSGTYTDWTENGIIPYLSASDDSNNIFESTTDLSKEGWFTFADTINTGSGYSVTMYVEFDSSGDEVCNWYIDTTGDNTPEFQGTIFNGGSGGLKNTGVISGLDTTAEINAARVYFEYDSYWSSDDMQIDYVYLNIARAEIYDDIEVTFRTNESGVWRDADLDNGVGNGTYYCFNTSWIDSFSTRYWWSVNTSDGFSGWDNDTYFFTTKANSPPLNSNPVPVSGATHVGLGLVGYDSRFGVSVSDVDDLVQDLDIIWRTNESGVWKIMGVNNSVDGGVYYCDNVSWVDGFSTRYWWSVNTSDGFGGWDNDTYWFITQGLPPSTSVDSISPYWQNNVPEVNIFATNNSVHTDNVTLYYRYSMNNVSWGSWTKWIGVNNPDSCIPWAWTFDCPSGSGYYEFYSMGVNDSDYEIAPVTADTRCHVNYSSWDRFGYEHVGCYPDALYYPEENSSSVLGSNFICPSSGIGNNITVFITNFNSSTNVTCAIYNASGRDLVGYTEEKNIGYVSGWFIFDFIGEPVLVAGTEYYLLAWGDGGFLRYDVNYSHVIVGRWLNYTGVFPDNIGELEFMDNFVMSVYCRYTEYEASAPTASLIYPSPNGTMGVELSPILNVSLYDSNFDDVSVTFYNFSDDSVIGTDIVVSGSGYASAVWSGLANNSIYSWYVTLNDGYYNITEPDGVGSFWCFTTGLIANNPPFIPSDPDPVNHATSVDINVNLSWLGGDPDCGNIVTYDIYFGTTENPPLYESNYSTTSYNPGTINLNTKYYWKIISIDNYGANTSGPIWDFTTIYVNQPPNKPSNPIPEDGKKSVNTDQDLYWTGGDPDAGDTVTYDVYFGYKLPIQKVASNISTLIHNPGVLTNGLTYFWKIVSWDNHGLSTIGPQWYFTTINATNKPPNKPNKPSGITSGKIGTTHSYTSSTTDPNDDYVYYWYDWGDGTNSGWDGPYYSGDNVTIAHAWIGKGTYPIKVKAKDVYGAESVWSDPLVISMPKTKIYNQIVELLYRILARFPFLEKIMHHLPFFEKILNQIL